MCEGGGEGLRGVGNDDIVISMFFVRKNLVLINGKMEKIVLI